MHVNDNHLKLEQSYLFSTIARKVKAFREANPETRIISLGIGDVTQPLVPAVIAALNEATQEMASASTFRGYCPDAEGYEFAREAVAEHLGRLGDMVGIDEVFVSDGAKSDLGNILDIVAPGSRVLIADPVYPAYVDTNVMMGNEVVYIHGSAENGFAPLPDDSIDVDVIYICSPNNPTGAVYGVQALAEWVEYALAHKSLILFDSAYEAFIRSDGLPHTIYQIDGAERCAIEISSLSKRAGFTGLRAGYTIVPKTLEIADGDLNALWRRRQNTKFNGVPYIVQRAAEAAFSPQGLRETTAQVDGYLANARLIAEAFDELGITYTGGVNAPYIWMRCPNAMRSWDFFDMLLEKAQVVGTPGVGFGPAGEGYLRLSAFGTREECSEAVTRIKALLG